VTQLPGFPDTNPLTANAPPIADQVSAHLTAAGRADPNALYAVWGGANDVFRAIDPAQPESADPLGYLILTAGQLSDEIARLRAGGARYVLVPTVPDVGSTPFGTTLGSANAAAASSLVAAYNQALFGDLAASGVRVIPLDTFTLLREVVASPATYGLVNVTTPACGSMPSLLCSASDLVAPDAAQTFLFADDVHPTTAGHRLVSDYALGVLRAPAAISLLAESPLVTRAALFRTIYDQAAVARSEAATHLWASAGAGRLEYESSSAQPGSDGDPRDVAIGIDRRVSPQLTLGAALAAGRVEPDFSGNGGRYQQDETTLALYAVYRGGSWHASALMAAGKLDFDTRRVVALGPASRAMEGSTSGWSRSLGILAGYDFSTLGVRHGPVVGLLVQRVRVDAFAEGGQSATDMAFGEQKRDSRVGSLGYQVAFDGQLLSPYARLTVDREFEDDGRHVTASLATLPGNSFDLPAVTPDRTYATAVLGVGLRFTPTINANVALSGRLGQDDVRDYAVQAGLSIGF
jgi:outer membrane lipase/esterase